MVEKNPSKEESTQAKVIVFDQKDNEKFKQERDRIRDLAVMLRNSGLNVINTILAIHDRDALKIYNVGDNKNLGCISVFFKDAPKEEEAAKKYYQFRMKEAEGFLLSKQYKILKSQIVYGNDYPVGKIIVELR